MVKRKGGRKKRKLKDLIEYSILIAVCTVFLFTAISYVLNPPPAFQRTLNSRPPW